MRAEWPVLVARGLKKAFIRATQGVSELDREFAHNAACCPVPWGAYHALLPGSAGIDQARRFLRTVRPYQPRECMVDCEVDGITARQIVDFCETVEAETQQLTVIYINADTASKLSRELDAELAKRPLMVASWTTGATPAMPRPWRGKPWKYWQYSNQGHLPVGGHRVDLGRIHP